MLIGEKLIIAAFILVVIGIATANRLDPNQSLVIFILGFILLFAGLIISAMKYFFGNPYMGTSLKNKYQKSRGK